MCKDVQAQAVLYQESIRNASELEDTTGVELYPAAAGGKARPMVVIKQVRSLHACARTHMFAMTGLMHTGRCSALLSCGMPSSPPKLVWHMDAAEVFLCWQVMCVQAAGALMC